MPLPRQAPPYTRDRPSPRYQQLLGFYRALHTDGDPDKGQPPEETFDGRSLPPQAWRIKQLIDLHGARSVLDYGAGKGRQYEVSPFVAPDGATAANVQSYWGVETITLYDPGHAPHSALPFGKFDAVISTDVMEHCPEEDLPWILNEIFGFATKFVFVNIASFPAKKILPDGQNAHCTIKPLEWWVRCLGAAGRRFPAVRWYAVVQTRKDETSGEFTYVEHMLKG